MKRIVIAPAAAVLLLAAGCSSHAGIPLAASSSTAPVAVASSAPAVAATAPASATCDAFAQVYNGQLAPLLRSTGDGGNVYITQLKDAFTALANTVGSATDPYSQTIASDAQAVAADPLDYTAMGSFTTDLSKFLAACGVAPSAS